MGSITLKGPMSLYKSSVLLEDFVLPEEVTGLHAVTRLGICAKKIIPWYDLIGHLIGKGMILLGGTRGGP
jgi:hypothetical protein